MQDYPRDLAASIRRQLEALSARNDRECGQARKDAEERKYREEYVRRHDPNNQPPSAA